MKPPSFALMVMTASLSFSSFAAQEPKRLIETSPGVQFWATPEEMAALSEKSHAEGKCAGFIDVTDFPVFYTPAPKSTLSLAGREPKEQMKVVPLVKLADEGNLLAIITKLSAYEDRLNTTQNGVDSANWIKSQYEKIGSGRTDIRVELFAHKFKQPSVIATIEGSGAEKNEIVVIGGHIDSISSGKMAPGADDNASGTATVIEAFRLIAESGLKPNRTIQFMGYAGEEKGLLGSQDIAARYRSESKVVVGALQFDMTMYPGSTPKITFITDYTNRDLTQFVQRLSDEYVKAVWAEDRCGYGCSDHASWTKAGYPSAFPFESAFDGHNPDIHTPRDTMKNLDSGHGLNFVKLAVAFGIELAEAAPVSSSEPAPAPVPGRKPNGKSSWPSFTSR